jgi:hypothetical protein
MTDDINPQIGADDDDPANDLMAELLWEAAERGIPDQDLAEAMLAYAAFLLTPLVAARRLANLRFEKEAT